MHNVPRIFIYEYQETEEPSLYLHIHDVKLPSFDREFSMLRSCEFLHWMFTWYYEIVFPQYTAQDGRGKVCKILVY